METTVFEKGKQKMSALKKGATAVVIGSSVALAGALPVFAEDASVESALTSGMSSAASSMTGMIAKVVPIVIPIMTAVIVVKFGIKFFKNMSGKASS